MKEILTVCGFVSLIAFSMIGYNLHTNNQKRAIYNECVTKQIEIPRDLNCPWILR